MAVKIANIWLKPLDLSGPIDSELKKTRPKIQNQSSLPQNITEQKNISYVPTFWKTNTFFRNDVGVGWKNFQGCVLKPIFCEDKCKILM